MVSVCNTEYMRICIEDGLCKVCECSDSYKRILKKLSLVLSWLKNVKNRIDYDDKLKSTLRRQGRKYNCLFTTQVINLLEKIINNMRSCVEKCGTQKLTTNDCPEYLYCDADSIAKLYRYFKNPDTIVVTSNVLTLIIEEKITGRSHGQGDLEDQLATSFDMLPDYMKQSRCVFIALIPEKGGLPKGFEADRKTKFLKYKGTGALFDPPTLYLYNIQKTLF